MALYLEKWAKRDKAKVYKPYNMYNEQPYNAQTVASLCFILGDLEGSNRGKSQLNGL